MNTYPFFFASLVPPEKIEEVLGHTDYVVNTENKQFVYYFKDEYDFAMIFRNFFNNDDQLLIDEEYDYYYQQNSF